MPTLPSVSCEAIPSGRLAEASAKPTGKVRRVTVMASLSFHVVRSRAEGNDDLLLGMSRRCLLGSRSTSLKCWLGEFHSHPSCPPFTFRHFLSSCVRDGHPNNCGGSEFLSFVDEKTSTTGPLPLFPSFARRHSIPARPRRRPRLSFNQQESSRAGSCRARLRLRLFTLYFIALYLWPQVLVITQFLWKEQLSDDKIGTSTARSAAPPRSLRSQVRLHSPTTSTSAKQKILASPTYTSTSRI